MKKIITEKEYLKALSIVEDYKEQQKNKVVKITFTEEEIVTNRFKKFHYDAVAIWLSKKKQIPDRAPDAVINCEYEDFFTIENGRKVFRTYEDAYNHVIKEFKRKKMIL